MVKFLKSGKVVIVLNGRFAGHKAVVVRTFDEGQKKSNFGSALLVGINRYPKKVTRTMSKKRIASRSKITPFVKVMNYNHFLPTRYSYDLNDLPRVEVDEIKDPQNRVTVKKGVRTAFETRFKSGKSKWFFTKLRF
ncbi:ribosomal protein L27e [Fonticula alba]|uniref:60S ribosomal protein L27 n=1 Tax=Fonticula alba TaxID=691883 RepID=A0A058Z827_FONAL|nr:ribosomal protein L27e [Fonticula alba]KCV70439.1 ribosomal protein L27e [Fonticula alba]|eukprot:XP_009494955.1 ribosomal protein L27e [Fonticula alba]